VGLLCRQRLCRLQLCTLELRQLHFDLYIQYMCYCIIFGCVSVRASEFFEFSHTPQTRGHCTGYIVAIMLDLCTLLSVSSTCGTVCQQTVWILRHSNEQSHRLILRRFYIVSRIRYTGLLLVPLCGLSVHSHTVSVYSLFVSYCCFV